ncbi:hypothetical protein ACWCQ0_54825, partial [Streptomyces massasporeus]
RPRTGTKQEAGAPFFSYGGAYVVNTVTPTLRDTFVDPNGDKIQGAYQIFDSANDTQVGAVLRSAFVPSGQPAPVVVPAGVLTNGKTYKFRSSPYDGTHYNLGWSAWKTFTVDTTAPAAPLSVTSTDYPAGRWAKGAGQPGVFTITPPASDHNWLEWSLDGITWTKVATGGAAGAKTVSITPADNGAQSLLVRAVDRADNRSTVVDYAFNAARPLPDGRRHGRPRGQRRGRLRLDLPRDRYAHRHRHRHRRHDRRHRIHRPRRPRRPSGHRTGSHRRVAAGRRDRRSRCRTDGSEPSAAARSPTAVRGTVPPPSQRRGTTANTPSSSPAVPSRPFSRGSS